MTKDDKGVDIEEGVVYILSTFVGEELKEIFVASSEERMQEMADILMEDDENISIITSRTVIMDTIKLNETLH